LELNNMNEHIGNLFIKARFEEYGHTMGMPISPLEMRFAELIIEACVERADHSPWASGPVGRGILEHFGIDERRNIRHDLDQALVAEQIGKKCAECEVDCSKRMVEAAIRTADYEAGVIDGTVPERWASRPFTPLEIDVQCKERIAYERSHYAHVRIVELPYRKEKRFVLVYGKDDDATVTRGTGPFESIEKATKWFMNGGR
jgi:hypothetical protein